MINILILSEKNVYQYDKYILWFNIYFRPLYLPQDLINSCDFVSLLKDSVKDVIYGHINFHAEDLSVTIMSDEVII